MFRRLTSAFLGILLVSFAAHANETSRLSLSPEIQRGDLYNPKGLWPMVGVGFGTMDHNDQIRTGGLPMHFKLLGSYFFENAPWVADAGLGFHNQFLTQKGTGADNIQSLYTELAARYKLSNRWQLGAIWNTLVDNPDRYRSNTENLASFFGVQVMKEFVWEGTYLVRAGGRAMTDVGISGETVDTAMLELAVSFGGSKPTTIVEEKEPVIESTPIAPHLAKRAVQTFEFSDPGPVNFETDSTKLVKDSHRYLKRLARALADNRHLFDRIEIVGHADQRGPDYYNLNLSERRARAIANALIMAGVSQTQIKAVGRGEKDLVSRSLTPDALLKNRRVQMQFHGVKNQAALRNIIDSVPRG